MLPSQYRELAGAARLSSKLEQPRRHFRQEPLRETRAEARCVIQGCQEVSGDLPWETNRPRGLTVTPPRSFYALSKSFHPDVNRTDPNAARTFALLSESYTVLSDPSRRAAYDRDVLRLHQATSAEPRGSYHSAGGRPPSGLSKRRSTFRGPPPSFYRSGGWGAHGEKRQRAYEDSKTSSSRQRSGHGEQQQYGGMGPGSNPFGAHRADDNVPHFDREGHTRTHTREDQRRSQRHRSRRALGDDDVEFEPQASLTGHFFIVAAILAATFVAPLVYLQLMRAGRRHKKERAS